MRNAARGLKELRRRSAWNAARGLKELRRPSAWSVVRDPKERSRRSAANAAPVEMDNESRERISQGFIGRHDLCQ